MYCVKCGVELDDSQKSCPLCSTPVYFPEIKNPPERPYPERKGKESVNERGIYFVITFAFVIAAIVCVMCDLNISGSIVWSGLVVGALGVFYVAFILPGWFSRWHPDIFIPSTFVAIGAYLLYINLWSGGHWFLSFAFPLTGGVALIVSAVTILVHYLKHGRLYIFGGAFIAAACLCPVIEWLAIITFDLKRVFLWSMYPTVALGLIGIMLIIIAIVKPFKESLKRIFFLS